MRLRPFLFALVSACTHHTTPPDAGGCGTYNLGPASTVSQASCSQLCADHACSTGFCSVQTDTVGDAILTCSQDHTGRRPRGLVAPRGRGRGCVAGRMFARTSHLEAASVLAFDRIAAELATFGAPDQLRDAARRAACDEVRHARLMAELAERCHARVPRVHVREHAQRDLAAFARENSSEGCVRETYGAAIALHQSTHAHDARVREVMASIARDEVRHAELAWRIDAWVRTALSASEYARVARARARTAARLVARERAAGNSPVTRALGMPSAAQRHALATSLQRQLWS